MATLMDSLKKSLTGEAPKAPELGQTQRVQGLLEAKAGKALADDTGPARSTIGETSAALQTKAALTDQSLQNKLQSASITQEQAAQDVKVEEERKNLGSQVEEYRSAFERQSDNLLRDFERDSRQLEDTRTQSKTEQLGFLLRLQDKQYIDQLQMEGDKARLNSNIGFKEAAFRSQLEDNMTLFKNDQMFKKFVNASERDFREQLGKMDINFAMQVASNAQQAANQQSMFSGIGSLVSAGASIYDKSGTPAAPQNVGAPPKVT